MTIPSVTPPYIQIFANSAATVFAFSFKIFAATDLIVGFITAGVYIPQTSGFTVKGIDNNNGGTVEFATAPPFGLLVDIRSITPQIQPTEFANLGAYLPENSTEAFDRLTRIIQDLTRLTYTFGIHGNDQEATPWPALPTNRAGAALVFDSNSLPTLGVPVAGTITSELIASLLTPAQIGSLLYPRTAAENAAGVTPTNITYPPGNVLRYGADPAGVADSTAAIQTAIDLQNNWQVYSSAIGNKFSPGPDLSQGGEVVIPGGVYSISNTITLAPGIRLRGASAVLNNGTVYTGSGQHFTVLRASVSFPSQQYMIDSGTYRLKNEVTGAAVVPYRVLSTSDLFIRANDLDNVYCNFMQSMTVQNLQLDGNTHASGGLRIQASAFFHIDGVTIINTQYVGFAFLGCFEFAIGKVSAIAPAPLLIIGCESAMQDGGECQIYAVASASWTLANQATINSIIYPYADPIGNWYGLTLKVINIQWSLNVTLTYLSANAGNVGLECYHSNCNILHWENEFTADGANPGALFLLRGGAQVSCLGLSTKATCALSTGDSASRLIIRDPHAINVPVSFIPLNAESSSAFEVQLHNCRQSDPILGSVTHYSIVNLTRVFPATGPLTLNARPGGSTTRDGLVAAAPCTIDAALTFIENNPHIKEWTISLSNADTNTIGAAHVIKDCRITLTTASGTAAVSATTALTVEGVKLLCAFCSLSGWTTNALFDCQGWNEIEFGASCVVSIPAGKTIFQASQSASRTARVLTGGYFPSITFGSGAGLCNGNFSFVNYEDTFISPTVTGTPALEAISVARVKKIASTIV